MITVEPLMDANKTSEKSPLMEASLIQGLGITVMYHCGMRISTLEVVDPL